MPPGGYRTLVQQTFIRVLGITYLGILCFVIAAVLSFSLNRFFEKVFPPRGGSSTPGLMFQIVLKIGCICLIALCTRALLNAIPFPLDNFWGYRHKKQAEINGGVIIAFSLFFFQTELKEALHELLGRLRPDAGAVS